MRHAYIKHGQQLQWGNPEALNEQDKQSNSLRTKNISQTS
jgi:hypothetical protein